MRLGTGLLYEGRTLQGARPKLADFCSAVDKEAPDRYAEEVAQLTDMYRDGKLRPYVSERYPLAEAGTALNVLETRRARGKVLIDIRTSG